jgi:anaerobic magnesium-protoporphyrin IX monomethyl ester cyclase
MSSSFKTVLVLAPPVWPNLPPLGIAFLQSFAARYKLTVDLFDLNNYFYTRVADSLKKEWLKSCHKTLEETLFSYLTSNYPKEWDELFAFLLQYEVIGFSCFKSNFKTTLEIIELLKQKRPGLQIITGGPEITRQFFKAKGTIPDLIAQACHLAVVGEGELPLYKYLSGKESKKYALFEELPDLKELAFPTYAGLDLSLYPKKNSLALQFSRGCIRHCRFCSERRLYKGFRTRAVANLMAEIEFHQKHHHTNTFIFFDSLINADLIKLEKLCEAIISRFGKINWEAQLAVRSYMHERLFSKIKQSGCYNLFVGLESGADTVLKRMNKGYTSRQAQEFLQKLAKSGLAFGLSLIVGYPGETEEDFEQSLDFVLSNKNLIPKIEQLNPFTYYEGTRVPGAKPGRPGKQAIERMQIFREALRRNGMKHTKAFIGNLIEK